MIMQNALKGEQLSWCLDFSGCHAPDLTLKSHLGKTCLGVISSAKPIFSNRPSTKKKQKKSIKHNFKPKMLSITLDPSLLKCHFYAQVIYILEIH